MSPDTPVTSSAITLLCPAAILMIRLRLYHPDDGPRLLHLFRDTIRRVNIRDYPASQIAAWSSDDIDETAWCRRFENRFVVVAEDSSEPPRVAGFAELEPDGHIDRVYVSADHQRQGVGRAMLQAILAKADRQGLKRLFVEASLTALPFFESLGFSTIARQTVECRGERLVNVRMEWLRSETL